MIGISLFATCWANLEIKYQWKTIDFNYESVEKRQEAIDAKAFIEGNVIPVGLDIYKDRLFLSLPRLKRGVPATLAYINMTAEAERKSKRAAHIFIRINEKLINFRVALVIPHLVLVPCRVYRRTLIKFLFTDVRVNAE